MRTDSLIERLTGGLRPVRPRSILREACILGLLGFAEVAVFFTMGFMRPDMAGAMVAPSFWWKSLSMGFMAILGTGIALWSIDPTRSPRRGLRWIPICVALIFASGWLVDGAEGGWTSLLVRLDWRDGIQCSSKMIALSVPAVAAFALLIRRGAPSDRTGTALAAAFASAAWGAFVFVFACPYDDALYIAVWYTVGCGIVTVIGHWALSYLARW